jgi:hypothetical protein
MNEIHDQKLKSRIFKLFLEITAGTSGQGDPVSSTTLAKIQKTFPDVTTMTISSENQVRIFTK